MPVVAINKNTEEIAKRDLIIMAKKEIIPLVIAIFPILATITLSKRGLKIAMNMIKGMIGIIGFSICFIGIPLMDKINTGYKKKGTSWVIL